MQEDPTVQQVMAMTPFTQVLERKNAEPRAYVHAIIAQRSESLPPREAAPPVSLSADEEVRRYRSSSEPPTRLGLPDSSESVSERLELPLPPSYRRVIQTQGTAGRGRARGSKDVR